MSFHRFMFKLVIYNESLFNKSFKLIHHLYSFNIVFTLNLITYPKELKNVICFQNRFLATYLKTIILPNIILKYGSFQEEWVNSNIIRAYNSSLCSFGS